MHADSRGVEQNCAWAVYWYALAAQQGDSMATDNIELDLPKLTALRVSRPSINLRAKPGTDAEVIVSQSQGTTVDRLCEDNGWYEVYVRQERKIGYVAPSLVVAAN